MLQCRAQDLRLIVEQAPPLLPLGADQIGHFGLQDHRAAIMGPMLGDLHPAIIAHRLIEDEMVPGMTRAAHRDPLGPRHALGHMELRGVGHELEIV